MDLLPFLKDNWSTVIAAPWVFAAFATLCGGLGFALGRFWRAELIALLYGRIEQRDERIADLERRISEFSPSKEKRKIREDLAQFSMECASIKDKYLQFNDKEIDDIFRTWTKKVMTYLESELDKSYAVRFLDETGFMPIFMTGDGTPKQKNLAVFMDHRQQRLSEIIRGFS